MLSSFPRLAVRVVHAPARLLCSSVCAEGGRPSQRPFGESIPSPSSQYVDPSFTVPSTKPCAAAPSHSHASSSRHKRLRVGTDGLWSQDFSQQPGHWSGAGSAVLYGHQPPKACFGTQSRETEPFAADSDISSSDWSPGTQQLNKSLERLLLETYKLLQAGKPEPAEQLVVDGAWPAAVSGSRMSSPHHGIYAVRAILAIDAPTSTRCRPMHQFTAPVLSSATAFKHPCALEGIQVLVLLH